MSEKIKNDIDPELDVIELLNTKKQNTEILSITNAAVNALSNHAHDKPQSIAAGEERSKENVFNDADSTSFNGKHKVRVSSSLLREIQMPSSEEIRHDTSPNLFTSSSSSNQSSIQASGPIPTVIKYSSEPYEPTVDTISNHTHKHHTSPIVIKHHISTLHSTINDDDTEESTSTVPETPTPYVNNNITTDNIIVKDTDGEITQKSPLFVSTKPQDALVTTLYQGAPSTNVMIVPHSEKGQVKAMSFSGSSKEKATKEILSKKQQGKVSLRRVVQPKFVATKPTQNENITVNDAKTTDDTTTQITNTIEKRISDLMTTMGVIETKCAENHTWQLQQQQTLEQSMKERDERRLQNLEDMQKQLLECQLKNVSTVAYPNMAYQVPYNGPTTNIPQSTIASTINLPINQKVPLTNEPCTTTSTVPNQQSTIKQPVMVVAQQSQVPSSHHQVTVNPGETPVTHSQHGKHIPQYNMADKHKTPSSFKTTVYTKPHVTASGLKRKFVRNTRTQTSPQYSTSSSEISSSPLETPLPRKRPPVPISRMSKNEGETSNRHVHFDTPNIKQNKKQADQQRQERIVTAVDQPVISSATQYYRSPLKSSDYIVNDIGKLRQELKDALKETEQTKLSLRNLHDNIHSQISDNEDILITPDHTQSYPLDAYLRATHDIPEESDSVKCEDIILPEKVVKSPVSMHYNDALSILRDVQKQKETLETNLLSLTRKHDEQHLYKLVDELTNETSNNETMRIRKEVAKKIDEISNVVKSELKEEEERKEMLKREKTEKEVEKKKNIATIRTGLPLSTERRAKLRNIGKENNQLRNKTNIKPKQITKPVTKATTSKQPSTKQDQSYVSRVYGRDDHVPRRTTIKPSYMRHQSPVKNTSVSMLKEKESFNDSTTTTSSDDSSVQHRGHFIKHKPKYYFQPSEVTVKPTKIKHLSTPLQGELLSMAIPLGKPKTDPALRLPLHLTHAESRNEISMRKPVVRTLIKQPNVAVISIKDDHYMSDKGCDRKPEELEEMKEKRNLEKQGLPNVDINTSISDISDICPSSKNIGPQIISCPEPQHRPGASEYEEFKDYEAIQDLHELTNDEDNGESNVVASATSVISLHGSKPLQSSYQGPVFPPRHIPPSTHHPDTIYTTKTIGETLEEKALEWVEKELLARVVSEISPTKPDPTCVKDSVSSSTSDVSSAEPGLLATVGQRGIQLFVDAGIPVDNELIHNLIVEVLKEKVANIIGYPKPMKEELTPPPSPRIQDEQRAEDDYSDDLESISEEQSRIETPIRTPSTDNRVVQSGSASYIATPEESTISALSDTLPPDEHFQKMQIENMDNTIEEGRLEESDYGTPVATPLATPLATPTPSPRTTLAVVVGTPEVSEQEQGSIKSGVETPEMTESIRETITEESPVELKEQTYVDSGSDDEVKAPPSPVVVQPKQDYTNSPSSITTTTTTTTTITTQSSLGTVATEDEISEGEQLQPYVHVGQYSEGEFVAPAAMISGIGHMTTMHEIPDDIFDDALEITGSNRRDVFKQAVVGLLENDGNEEGSGEITDNTTSNIDDISRSEGELDVVSTLLQKIRQLPERTPKKRMVIPDDQPATEQDTDSVGELLQPHRTTVWRMLPKAESASELTPSVWRTLPRMISDGADNISPGELHKPLNQIMPVSYKDDTLDRPQGSSVFDSDENNNTSENSTDPKSDTMKPLMFSITPQVSSPRTQVPRVVQVMPAQESDSSLSKLSAGESSPGTKFKIPGLSGHGKEGTDVTVETLSDYDETGLLEEERDSPQRIELKLPTDTVSQDESPSLSEEPLTFEHDDTVGDTSLSGGELP